MRVFSASENHPKASLLSTGENTVFVLLIPENPMDSGHQLSEDAL